MPERVPHVYIVEDDVAVRAALAMLVAAWGWVAHPFASPRAFLEALPDDFPPRAGLILDLQLPEMHGAELSEALARSGRSLPTVVLTAVPRSRLADRALEAGATEVLPKPACSRALRDSLDRAMEIPCTST